MKFSLFKNDKSTAKDELIILILMLAFLGIGVALIINTPSFWILDSVSTGVLGVLCVLIAVMFLPGLIYHILTNDKKLIDDKNKDTGM